MNEIKVPKEEFAATQIAFGETIKKTNEQKIAENLRKSVSLGSFFGQNIQKIILCPVIVPENLRHHYPEERRFTPKDKTLTLCIHFDYDNFLIRTPQECEEIIEKKMRQELSEIRQIRGLKKIKFDEEAWKKCVLGL